MTVTATYDDASTANVTSSATFTGYNMSTPGEQTVTVSYTENNITKTASYTITVNALPQYTVTLSDDNTSLTEASAGAGVTLPTRSALNGYAFAGWSDTNVTPETTTAPTIIAAGKYYPTADITLFPVYTKTVGGGGTSHESASVSISEYASAHSWVSGSSNGPQYTEVVLNADVNATTTAGGNNGKYYNDWRFYTTNSGNIIITTTRGELTSVTFTFTNANNGVLSYGNTSVSSGNSVNVTGTNAEFTVSGSSKAAGQIRITAISVNYDVTGSSTTYYWSTPEAPAVEMPVITIAETPFLFSTTVTITCATDGATIKYSYDGETWSDYPNAGLTITETKTIYAKGMKDQDESQVVQATATKDLAQPTVTISGDLIVDLDGETNVNAGTLSATVTYNNEAVASATVTWGSNHTDIATIDASTGAVTLLTTGEVTFTATYAGNGDYSEASGTKTITVINSKAPGTVYNPYTVAQALTAINALSNNGTLDDKYVSGIISTVSSYSSNAITYWISDDGTTSSQMQVYKGKGLDGAKFSAKTDLTVGEKVVLFGQLKKYVSGNTTTPEYNSNSKIVSLIRPGTGGDPATIVGTVVDFTIANNENYIVASNTTLTVNGTLTNNGTAANLIIEEGGQIILPEDASVSATIKRSVKGNAKAAEWEAFASTINNPAIESTNLITETYDLYMYDEAATGAEWRNYKVNTGAFANLANSRGYLYRNAATMDITITGSLNTSDISTYTLSRNSEDANIIGFNFVGNPYQMEIYKGVAISNEYLETGYYVLENGGWAVKDDNVAIAPGAGILVQAKDGGHNQALDITYTGASAKANHDNIMFTVKNSEYSDVAYAMFDKGHGLNKIEHRNANIPMLYIPQNGERFAIAMMDDNTQMFDLSFKAMTTGKYTISMNAKGNFSYIHLIDRLTGDDTNLLIEDYSFVGSPKDNAERFIVKLSYDNGSSTSSETFAYQSGNDIIVNGEGTLEVYDVIGRKVMNTTINGVQTVTGLNNGFYIFRLNEKTQKIVVR
ncbi:MAG: hypothetical protein IJT45_07685 [Bacteroidales bacterium]|nr:hypothetical protein [Bacteroidales bacterium]